MTDSFIQSIRPSDLGISVPNDQFRDIQLEAIEWAVEQFEAGYRFVAMALPTGSGKSIFAVALSRLMQLRTIILTETKGLQEQYIKLGGIEDIRGQTNYQCRDDESVTCKEGKLAGGCRYANREWEEASECSYDRRKQVCRSAQIVCTNYDFHMSLTGMGGRLERLKAEALRFGPNPFELMICDEAHAIDNKLSSYVSSKIWEHDLAGIGMKKGDYPAGEELAEWVSWAGEALVSIEVKIAEVKEKIRLLKKSPRKLVDDLRRLESLAARVAKIAEAGAGAGVSTDGDEWVVEREEGTRLGRLWKFDSISPGRHAERYLFSGVARVLEMSATLKPRTVTDQFIRRDQVAYRAWKRVFKASRHQILLAGVRKADGQLVRLDRRTSKEDLKLWMDWLDEEVIKPWLGHKGLIQTVSYDRAKWIMEASRYSQYMIGNTSDPDSESAVEVAEKFKRSSAPCILVSPSFGTGWDFPHDLARWSVLVKVPFEAANSKIARRRQERDKQYANFRAMQAVEQAVGRTMRAEDDWAVILLADGHFEWFLNKNRALAQDWFVNSVRRVGRVPGPVAKAG